MKRALAIAERLSGPAIKLIVAVNLLFFLSFFAVLVFATQKVAAQDAVCKGKDLVSQLQTEDPAQYDAIVAESRTILNGRGLLWKIEKEGVAPSYLFGTMHMTDPRVTALTSGAETAFKSAKTVVIETTDILDQGKMMAALAAEPDLMMFTDGTTLASLLSPEDKAIFEKSLADRGIPPASVAKMKPWMLSAMLALPACEMARKAQGAPVLDVKLAEDAKAHGKELKGLESAADQLRAMASLPMDFHMRGLIDSLKLGDGMDDVMETMIVLYEREDIGMVVPLMKAAMADMGVDDSGDYAEFEQTMITARNAKMAEHAAPILDAGSAFIAVGALHLPGPKGLIEDFRNAGYTVTLVQ